MDTYQKVTFLGNFISKYDYEIFIASLQNMLRSTHTVKRFVLFQMTILYTLLFKATMENFIFSNFLRFCHEVPLIFNSNLKHNRESP